MALKSLQLSQFTVFDNAIFEFSSGINVLIGKNSTGKSHVLKAMYSLLRGITEAKASELGVKEQTRRKLNAVFRPDRLDRLIRRPTADPTRGAEMHLATDAGESFWTLKDGVLSVLPTDGHIVPPPSLYITSRDVLAFFKGFVALYEKREISFDETYADLCRALELEVMRELPPILRDLEPVLGGTVRREREGFYVSLGGEEFEAHLVGEGLRKVATLVQLIANGSLTQSSVLFWDEPEAGLNPQMIAAIAEFIRKLAAWGVQVFVASHDYLLTSRLSLLAETKVEPTVPTRFFSLDRDGANDPVEVEQGDSLAIIEKNPILKAHADYYDDKHELFAELDEREGEPK